MMSFTKKPGLIKFHVSLAIMLLEWVPHQYQLSPGAGPPPLRKWAGFPPVAPAPAVCLVLIIYNIPIHLLPQSHDLPLSNTTPPTLYILPNLFLFVKPILLLAFQFLVSPFSIPTKSIGAF